MSGEENTYLCPVCGKPFDTDDRLSDFAIAAHEKDHTPGRNNPANMIRYDGDSLMWCCKLCGVPLHPGDHTARQMVIGHCRVVHDSVMGPSSSAPVTARGGSRGSGSRGAADIAGDVGEAIVDGIGRAVGGIFRAFGGD